MDYNYITNIKSCHIAIPHLLHYSHIPTICIAMFFAIFILTKNRTLVSYVFFFMVSSFSLWVMGSYITWIGTDGSYIMFSWATLAIFDVLMYLSSVYFVYLFIDGKDISYFKKVILLILFIPVLFLFTTSINLKSFNLMECEATESYFNSYVYFVEIISVLWIIFIVINRYFRSTSELRRKIAFLSVGLVFFLAVYFLLGLLAAQDILPYSFEFYALFGMDVFIAVMAYLIVQYGAMDIKLARAQALVWSLILLIGAQFFFIRNPTNQVLNSIAFVLVCFIGYGVVKSVRREEQQNDRLIHFSKELTRANAELKRLDSAKSEFISIASHQLRTPLTAIKGYISLILEGAYGQNADKTDDALNKIFLANERLIQLVEDMLNLTRIESGRLDYHLEDNVQVEDILSELKDMFILRTQDKNLDFVIDTGDTQLPPIKADKSKLREVISNLIDNAIKYTKEGFIHVSAQKDGSIVRVTIADSGMGISEESLKTLFAKFSRGTDSTKVYTDGSGLGLYVGKNLIESQGGHIYAESDGVNKGSRFIVEMPIAKGN